MASQFSWFSFVTKEVTSKKRTPLPFQGLGWIKEFKTPHQRLHDNGKECKNYIAFLQRIDSLLRLNFFKRNKLTRIALNWRHCLVEFALPIHAIRLQGQSSPTCRLLFHCTSISILFPHGCLSSEKITFPFYIVEQIHQSVRISIAPTPTHPMWSDSLGEITILHPNLLKPPNLLKKPMWLADVPSWACHVHVSSTNLRVLANLNRELRLPLWFSM